MTSAADRQVDALRRVREALDTAPGAETLRRGLAAKHARVVATAAKILRDEAKEVRGAFEDDVLAALGSWMKEGGRADPGCTAKTALVAALVQSEVDRVHGVTPGLLRSLLRDAAHHVQWEKVYGGQVDVAGDLRITAAAGLVTVGDPQALTVLTDHLADPLLPVRRAAAKNLHAHGGQEAALLLRLRGRMGDADAEGLGEVLRALLALDPEAIDVAAQWLDTTDCDDAEAVFAEAALALGDVRTGAADERLRRAWDVNLDEERRRILVAALAQVRTEASLAFLIEVVREASTMLAEDAASLLNASLGEGDLRVAFHEALEERDDPAVRRAAGLE